MAIFGKYSPRQSRRYYSQGSSGQERRPDGIRQTGLRVCARHKWKEACRAGARHGHGVAAVSRQPRTATWWWMSGPRSGKFCSLLYFFPLWFVPKLIKRAAGNNVIEKELEAIGKYNRKTVTHHPTTHPEWGKCAEAGPCCLPVGPSAEHRGVGLRSLADLGLHSLTAGQSWASFFTSLCLDFQDRKCW